MATRKDDWSDEALTAERRTEGRATAIYRPVLLETEEFAGFCLVRNLSPNGMMGIAYAQFAAEQPVTIQFHPDYIATGTIVWSTDGRIGIKFFRRIDVDAVLQNLAKQYVGSRVNRAPRLNIECPGELIADGRSLPMTVQDISQRGLKAAVAFVKRDDEVVVRLSGMAPQRARVRWTQDGMAGLHFIQPIAFEDLAKWAIERQSG